jgi:hypothetical protein
MTVSRGNRQPPARQAQTQAQIQKCAPGEEQWALPVIPSEQFDCQACGVCCREAKDGRVLVYEEDLVRWRQQGRTDLLASLVPGHFGEKGFAADPEGKCCHLQPTARGFSCSIYETRGRTCRALVAGSAQCLAFRREHGLRDP